MSAAALHELWVAASAHAYPIAACAARLGPVAFLCPLLGAQASTWPSRLAVCLALAGGVHVAGGVTVAIPCSAWAAAWGLGREGLFGLVIGMVASLPFDAARMGGRFADAVRGTSAEATLPFAGSVEAASGDLLYRLLVSAAASSGTAYFAIGGMLRSFRAVPLGAFAPDAAVVTAVVTLVGTAVSAGFAVGAPVVGCSLAVDALISLAARAAGGPHLSDLAAPARILLGAAAMWLSLGVVCERLLATQWASLAELGGIQ